MKLIKNSIALFILICGLFFLTYLVYSFWNSFILQQEKFIITSDNAGIGLTLTFFLILLLPIALCFIVSGYLISETRLSKTVTSSLKDIFTILLLISGMFAFSGTLYFAIVPSIQQQEFQLFIDNSLFISPAIVLFFLTFLAYRKSLRQLMATRQLMRPFA